MAGKKGGWSPSWTPKHVKGSTWRALKKEFSAVQSSAASSEVNKIYGAISGASPATKYPKHPNQGGVAPSSHTSTSSHYKRSPQQQ